MPVRPDCKSTERRSMLLVVIVFLGLNYEHGNTVVIDVVDDAVVGSDVARVGQNQKTVPGDSCFISPRPSARLGCTRPSAFDRLTIYYLSGGGPEGRKRW